MLPSLHMNTLYVKCNSLYLSIVSWLFQALPFYVQTTPSNIPPLPAHRPETLQCHWRHRWPKWLGLAEYLDIQNQWMLNDCTKTTKLLACNYIPKRLTPVVIHTLKQSEFKMRELLFLLKSLRVTWPSLLPMTASSDLVCVQNVPSTSKWGLHLPGPVWWAAPEYRGGPSTRVDPTSSFCLTESEDSIKTVFLLNP